MNMLVVQEIKFKPTYIESIITNEGKHSQLVWNSSIKGTVTKIEFDKKRVCGIIFKLKQFSVVIITCHVIRI